MARRNQGSTSLGRQPVGRAALAAEKRRLLAIASRAELCRRSLSHFVRLAIAAGVVHGIRKVLWGWHLEAFCWQTQLQFEGWLVAYDRGTPEMVARQREAWERTGAAWEDGLPNPWERYVLVQNELDNLPPGTLKSTIAMVCANAWIWLHEPRFMFGAASGIDANVTRDSNATRDLVRSAWYRETFAIAWEAGADEAPSEEDEKDPDFDIDAKKDAVSDWRTTVGGHRYSRTIQRGFTGLHLDGILIDDPDDADRVWNEAARVRPQNRFTRAIENRTNDERRTIRKVMQQVVHSQGFSAYLLSIARWSPANPKGWMWFCIPAEFGFQPEDAPRETVWGKFDPRTERGQTMHPMLSPGVLADKRLKLPGYEGQYNQNADSHANGIFERRFSRFFVYEHENVRVMRRRPEGCPKIEEQPPVVIRLEDLNRFTLSVDCNNSLNPSPTAKVSAVGLTVFGRRAEELYVLDDHTKVIGISGTYLAIYELLRAWYLDLILIEKKALGPSVVAELDRSIRRGWYLDPDTEKKVELVGPDGQSVRAHIESYDPGKDSKMTRAQGAVPSWQQGLIFAHEGASWLFPQVDENRKTVDEGWIAEVCGFPASRRNERVDTLSQVIAHGRGSSDAKSRWDALSRYG